ncbi:MAG: FCD domain-containing protein [Acetobacteraceae bacterium]|nr:FCD domain-containing protein [Acetobacteraceae bacterium]
MDGIAPRSEAERAFQALRAALLSGEFAPGERLLPAALRARFGFGLTPLREALMRLATEGLAEGEAQRGFRAPPLSAELVRELMGARREIEAICLSRAIRRGDAAWEAEARATFAALVATPLPRDPDDLSAAALWEERHRAFHLALVAGCGSPVRIGLWRNLSDRTERIRRLRLLRRHEQAAEVRDLNAEHLAILEAALARDEALALARADAHLAATEAAVLALLAPA